MQSDKPPEKKLKRSYVEEVFKQIQMQPDIVDIVIVNKARNPLKTTMEMSEALQFCGLYEILQEKALNSVKNIDPKDTLQMLRVRTKFHETLITPDDLITVMVVQNAQDKSNI